MTYYYSRGSAPWDDPTIWSLTPGGGSAGAYPHITDIGVILPGHTISVNSSMSVFAIEASGGTLIIAVGLTITFPDAPGTGLFIYAVNSGGVTLNGTTLSPVVFQSSTNNPVYPYTVNVEYIASDVRTISFGSLRCKNVVWTIGNIGYVLGFNKPTSTSYITNVTPLSRSPIIVEHQIDGRNYSRVYQRGSQAGVITVTGFCRWDSFVYQDLLNIQALKQTICFISEYVQLPRCRIDQKISYQPKSGSLYVPFSITLIEEH